MKTVALLLLLFLAWGTNVVRAAELTASAEWAASVQERVLSNWSRPAPRSAPVATCRIYLTISLAGTVEAAEFRQPCGDDALEQSIRAAVQRSSPLPLPRDPGAFQRLLVLNFQAR
ncbi:TonB C-terminal domain-containing protein [Luteimonas sp. MC1782]|nr:TonB C-terminal domain-containing protein [Luteimonas sp. MC1782]